MKKHLTSIFLICAASLTFAQQNPTGGSGNSTDWRRGGNLNAPPGQGGANNIFGTFWNSPIYTYTAGINRLRVNGTLVTPISGIAQDVSGYFGIAPNGYFASNSPWSMLHLEGSDNSGFGGGGWRQWMKTGVFII
jgi:hypothetical protein